jgi:hypothetical protein
VEFYVGSNDDRTGIMGVLFYYKIRTIAASKKRKPMQDLYTLKILWKYPPTFHGTSFHSDLYSKNISLDFVLVAKTINTRLPLSNNPIIQLYNIQ